MELKIGDVLENPVSGERIEFRQLPVDGEHDTLVMDHFWPVGHRTGEHTHPEMEEQWLVVSGMAAFRIDGVEQVAGPGERLVAAAGTPHASWNAGDAPVHVRIEMRPGLRWAEFVERLFELAAEGSTDRPGVPKGDRLAGLAREYPREIALSRR